MHTMSPEQIEAKAASVASLNARAERVTVEVGQTWRLLGSLYLVAHPRMPARADANRKASDIIRIVQVAGVNGKRTTRYVRVDPPRGGNGGRDHQSHPVKVSTLVRCYRLIDAEAHGRCPWCTAPTDTGGSCELCAQDSLAT